MEPEPGHFMRTAAGSTYLVLAKRPNTRPEPKSICKLELAKLEPGDPEPGRDAIIHEFQWNSRPKKRLPFRAVIR